MLHAEGEALVNSCRLHVKKLRVQTSKKQSEERVNSLLAQFERLETDYEVSGLAAVLRMTSSGSGNTNGKHHPPGSSDRTVRKDTSKQL
eukprot:678931-Hanusia_phi.AAC.3